MKIPADSIDDIIADAASRGFDLLPVDALISETAPQLDRHFFDSASITMIGYGVIPAKHLKDDTPWPLVGLTAQKHHIAVYVFAWKDGKGIAELYQGSMGKTNNGKSCIRFKQFADIEPDALAEAVRDTVAWAENES